MVSGRNQNRLFVLELLEQRFLLSGSNESVTIPAQSRSLDATDNHKLTAGDVRASLSYGVKVQILESSQLGTPFKSEDSHPNGITLFVQGTDGSDRIIFDEALVSGQGQFDHTTTAEAIDHSLNASRTRFDGRQGQLFTDSPVGGLPTNTIRDGQKARPIRIVVDSGAGADSVVNRTRYSMTILGGLGNDVLVGGESHDYLVGGAGDDVIQGGAGNDTILGGAGNDQLAGESGSDLIQGGDGDDTLIGGRGADSLYGNAGNDWLSGTRGQDRFDGGPGYDWFESTTDKNLKVHSGESGHHNCNLENCFTDVPDFQEGLDDAKVTEEPAEVAEGDLFRNLVSSPGIEGESSFTNSGPSGESTPSESKNSSPRFRLFLMQKDHQAPVDSLLRGLDDPLEMTGTVTRWSSRSETRHLGGLNREALTESRYFDEFLEHLYGFERGESFANESSGSGLQSIVTASVALTTAVAVGILVRVQAPPGQPTLANQEG